MNQYQPELTRGLKSFQNIWPVPELAGLSPANISIIWSRYPNDAYGVISSSIVLARLKLYFPYDYFLFLVVGDFTTPPKSTNNLGTVLLL